MDLIRICNSSWFNITFIYFIALTHLGAMSITFYSIFWIMMNVKWFIGVAMIFFATSPAFGGTLCILNILEDFFRVRAGWPILLNGEFLEHYVAKIITIIQNWKRS